jgi:hypothetical protein
MSMPLTAGSCKQTTPAAIEAVEWSIASTRWKAAIHFSLCNVNANELKGRVEVKRSKEH